MDIQGEKSLQVSRKLVSTIGAVPKKDRVRCSEGLNVPCLHTTPITHDAWKPLPIR